MSDKLKPWANLGFITDPAILEIGFKKFDTTLEGKGVLVQWNPNVRNGVYRTLMDIDSLQESLKSGEQNGTVKASKTIYKKAVEAMREDIESPETGSGWIPEYQALLPILEAWANGGDTGLK